MLDSYERFFNSGMINKDDFFNFCIQETIYIPFKIAKVEWENLKYRIKTNKEVYIRGYGRNAKNSYFFTDFYNQVYGHNNIKIDPTNNKAPSEVIRNLTGYSKTRRVNFKLISNYQVSHVFGRTKNVYTFTAPWNITYISKIIDPFTGHEAKGILVDEYKARFQQETFLRFTPLIEDYNQLICSEDFAYRMHSFFEKAVEMGSYGEKDFEHFKKSALEEFSPVIV